MNKDLTVIVTDDDEGHTVLMRRTLKRIGIENIVTFNNGQDTLNFFYERDFVDDSKHILLLDLGMPIITGIDVLKELKNNPKLKNIPVIIVTATDDPAEIDLCNRFGCNYYLTKPIILENFIKAFQSVGVY